MAESSTERFLRLVNEANAKIAADENAQEEILEVGDPVRLQRMAERRDKLGTLRAREHPGKRPKRNHGSVFGYTRLD